MRNWARNGYWHRVTQAGYDVPSSGAYIGNPAEPIWRVGPGSGGAIRADFLQPLTSADWEGNPDSFLRLQWTTVAAQGEAQYQPGFRFTFLEHYGIRSARVLAGKQITVSWQLRCPNVGAGQLGCQVVPVVWRGGLDLPAECRTPFPQISMQLWSGVPFSVYNHIARLDYTFTLPPMPLGVSVGPGSYLGIGLDLPAQYGPTLDIGPVQLNEGGPQPFEEVPYWEEVVMAAQP